MIIQAYLQPPPRGQARMPKGPDELGIKWQGRVLEGRSTLGEALEFHEDPWPLPKNQQP